MALINRVTRLFTADLHAVLDRIEEPEVLLKQAIREMEEELAGSEQRIKWLQHEDEDLQRRIEQIEQSLAEMDEQLDVCFVSDEEDLARTLIRRRLEAQRIVASLTERRAATEKMLADQERLLDENRGHLESLRQKTDLLTEDPRVGTSRGDELSFGHGFTVSNDEVEVAFLREKQRRSQS
ncbi:MAG: PspA/IM30 family protein [Pseudomonadales bacterium]